MTSDQLTIAAGGIGDVHEVMAVMDDSFDPRFGEAWTGSQCAGLLPMRGVWLTLAREAGKAIGFSLSRLVADEAELLLLAVRPSARRRGVGKMLLENFEATAADSGARRLHLEVRDGNHAIKMYEKAGFRLVAKRTNYYKGRDGRRYDALTLAKAAPLRG